MLNFNEHFPPHQFCILLSLTLYHLTRGPGSRKCPFLSAENSPFNYATHKPYKFSKTFGPDWITVSEIGEISGTPTTIGSNLDLVVRVTDKEDDFKEITISVADTVCNPEDRIEVNNIVATSTITAPIYDAPIANPTFTVIEGSPAHLGSGGHWLKKNGDNWATVYSGKFTEGTWYFACQIRIDVVSNTLWPLLSQIA